MNDASRIHQKLQRRSLDVILMQSFIYKSLFYISVCFELVTKIIKDINSTLNYGNWLQRRYKHKHMTGISQPHSKCVSVSMRDNDGAFGQNNCVFVLCLTKTHFSPSSLYNSAVSVDYICFNEERSVFRARVRLVLPSEINPRTRRLPFSPNISAKLKHIKKHCFKRKYISVRKYEVCLLEYINNSAY